MAARGLNKVLLIGNVGRDPEPRYTPSGSLVVTFSLATSRGRKQPDGSYTDETEWHRIVAWDRQAEFIQNYVGKGRKLYIEGRLQTRKYTDNNGNERSSTEIVAYEVMALDKATDDAGGDYDGVPAKAGNTSPRGDTFGTEEFDDVPF